MHAPIHVLCLAVCKDHAMRDSILLPEATALGTACASARLFYLGMGLVVKPHQHVSKYWVERQASLG